jgi:hypothetical protein
MPKVQELFILDASRRVLRASAPASALSVSVVIAALSLAFHDSLITFLVVWIVSFLSLTIALILSCNTKSSHVSTSRETLLPVSKSDTSKAQLRSDIGMVERMLSGYEPSVHREMGK